MNGNVHNHVSIEGTFGILAGLLGMPACGSVATVKNGGVSGVSGIVDEPSLQWKPLLVKSPT